MRYFALIFFLAGLFVSPAYSQLKNIKFEGAQRNYRIHLPSGYNPSTAYPLVLNLHGLNSNSEEQMLYSEMNKVADTARFIVAYPDGIDNTWNSGFNFPYNSGTNDIGFISALIDSISAMHKIKADMVYACGMSMGGFMSFRLACELNNKLAAIASVTGLMSSFTAANNSQDFNMPVVFFHGTDDQVVFYNGQLGFAGAEENAEWWANKNACHMDPEIKELPDTVNEGSKVYTVNYKECNGSSEVLLYKIENGGHSWPGAMEISTLGNTNKDIHASVEIWKFFKRHQKSMTSDLRSEAKPLPVLFPNPVMGQLFLKNIKEVFLIEVRDFSGRKLISRQNTQKEQSIDISGLEEGLYFVCLKTTKGQDCFKILKVNSY